MERAGWMLNFFMVLGFLLNVIGLALFFVFHTVLLAALLVLLGVLLFCSAFFAEIFRAVRMLKPIVRKYRASKTQAKQNT